MIYYISGTKMNRFDPQTQKCEEIKSRILESYTEKIRETARRNEWKSTGSGAMFMGEGMVTASPDTAARDINVIVDSVIEDNGLAVYSMTLDSVSGIYTHSDDGGSDGIVISHAERSYSQFDMNEDRIVVSEIDGAEAHIGIIKKGSTKCETLTEGESRERWPSWSRTKKNRIVYSGCGLAITKNSEEPAPMMPFFLKSTPGSTCVESPYYICALDLDSMELSELVIDDSQRYSYIKPFEAADGYLYYIKKPYKDEEKQSGGCLSALLAPFKLLGALFGFLNIFTMKYSGQTLTNGRGGSKAKNKSEYDMFIDGNLINAGREIERNQKSGDKFPGIIPRSFELCRRLGADGREEVIKRGVIAYAVDRSGVIYCSNGNHLLKLTPNGNRFDESVLAKDKAITFVSIS